MVSEAIELRCDDLEQRYCVLSNKVTTMDSWLEELTVKIAEHDAQFDALEGYVYDIQWLMMRKAKGKADDPTCPFLIVN